MAAGVVALNIKDGDGSTRTVYFWSSDGTTSGYLQPFHVPGNSAGSAAAFGSGANGATVPRVTVATDDGLHTKIGEVQSSPTANTILARLKDIYDGITTLHTDLVSIVSPADSTFTRPADTTAYAIGDLIANSTTAGSVTPLSFTGATKSGSGGSGKITRWVGWKSGSVAAIIRFHFLKTSHAVTNGDNGALVFTSLDNDNYIGAMDCVFLGSALTAIGSSSGEVAEGVPVGGASLDYKLASGDTIYVFAQAVSAFTPANAGTIGGRPQFEVYT